MNNVKVLSLFTIGVILVACGGPDWTRLKNAKTVSIVGVSNHDELTSYTEDGKIGEDGSSTIGIGEGLGVLGSVVSGKGLDGVKDELATRTANEKTTFENINAFQKNGLESVKNAIKRNKFTLKPYDVLSDIMLKTDPELAKSLVEDSESDVVVNVKYFFGYVSKDKNFGISKEFRLALRAKLEFADRKGYIGSRYYFIMSSKEKQRKANFLRLLRMILNPF